ncbi:excalibur calcium-binding domain-containing protein [Gordonia sp. NPDC003376]
MTRIKSVAIATLTGSALCAGLLAAAPASGAPAPTPAAYYKNCQAVRDAGAAPLYRGQDGYRPALDRDGDGIACEGGGARSSPTPRVQPTPKPTPQPRAQPKKKAPKSTPSPWSWGSVELFP